MVPGGKAREGAKYSLRVKPKVAYVCDECGHDSNIWEGMCPACGRYGTYKEISLTSKAGPKGKVLPGAPRLLSEISLDNEAKRISSGVPELDRVLGRGEKGRGTGMIPGSLILLAGDPGMGKSTLALQMAASVGSRENPALYIGGEESEVQIALRAERTNCRMDAVKAIYETDLDTIIATIADRKPPVVVIDSIQTCRDDTLPSRAGSVTQVMECSSRFLKFANTSGIPIFLVGHVVKDGAIAGPRTLEHTVDVTLFLEGEKGGELRLLRSFKNRFGTTEEIGLFKMREDGMQEAEEGGKLFIDQQSLETPGNVLTIASEGFRPLAIEVQALVTKTHFGMPRRAASGFDLSRLNLLIAVLEGRCGLNLGEQDVYLNVVGGVKLSEPAADLAVALAIASSLQGMILSGGVVAFGEVGLGGEVRRVSRMERRVLEADRLELTVAISPEGVKNSGKIKLYEVKDLKSALKCLY